MKQKLLIFFLFGLFALQSAFAQTRKITGTVKGSDDGLPLPGVSVMIQGTRIGTQTNAQGDYSIVLPNSSATGLTFTYIGYASKTIQIGSSNVVNTTLSSDSKSLNEVIVSSYGVSQTKREVGGSISKINSSEFANQPIASLQTALQGRAAGVSVIANNGIPGGAINVRIRGLGSFTGNGQPLYVVDGVQLSGETFTGFTQTNTLAGINPSDIETIEVLKDAASSSIYGAQGANGVVLITTKKGKAGKTNFNFNYYQGRQSVIKTFDVLNTQDFYNVRLEALTNANPTATATAIRNAALGNIGLPTTATDADIAAAPTTNWQDYAFKTGIVQNFEAAANGGSDKTTFYTSATYQDFATIITKADFKRGTFKMNVDHKASDKLSFNTNLNLSSVGQKGPFAVSGSFLGSPAFAASTILPSNPIFNADGTYYGLPGSGQSFIGVLNQNIVAVNEYNTNNTQTNQLIGSFTANYNITPSLQFKSFYSMDYRSLNAKSFRDPRTNDAFAVRGSVETFNDNRTNFQTTQSLNYNKAFNQDNKLSGLVAFEYRSVNSQQIYLYGTGVPSPAFQNAGATAVPVDIDQTYTGYKTLSYFGRLQYTFKQRYSVSGNIRYQGNSKFGDTNKFGLFGGLTGAWTISEEPFLKNVSWIDDLKLRATAGSAGIDNIGNFASLALYGTGPLYNGASGIAFTQLANPGLKWERSTQYDLGLDWSLFKNRVSGNFSYYLKRNTNLLLDQPISSLTGFTSVSSNVGTIENSGPEVEITTVNFQTKGGFRWSTDFNFTYTKNRITKLYNDLQILPSDFNTRVGYARGSIFTFPYAGVSPATGRPMWYDINNNITYSPTAADRRYIGSGLLPKYTGGITNNFSYKGFDLSGLIQYQYGQIATDSQVGFLYENGRRLINVVEDVYNRRWMTPGQITDVARPYDGGSEPQGIASTSGSRLLFKTDYIRLKQAQIGYNFAAKMLKKYKINTLRAYVQGTNLFTITKYPGYDPEYFDPTNANAGAIPQSKNVTFGIQLAL
ncbi:MAG: SusC/RagA family TonB-linked outer membrane protein [Sphingobacteriaceae bacterium]|nr:MAG: SusC/RagA family TonB-linked outer membrane protein [Sphingobacteriaceae bacterium]